MEKCLGWFLGRTDTMENENNSKQAQAMSESGGLESAINPHTAIVIEDGTDETNTRSHIPNFEWTKSSNSSDIKSEKLPDLNDTQTITNLKNEYEQRLQLKDDCIVKHNDQIQKLKRDLEAAKKQIETLQQEKIEIIGNLERVNDSKRKNEEINKKLIEDLKSYEKKNDELEKKNMKLTMENEKLKKSYEQKNMDLEEELRKLKEDKKQSNKSWQETNTHLRNEIKKLKEENRKFNSITETNDRKMKGKSSHNPGPEAESFYIQSYMEFMADMAEDSSSGKDSSIGDEDGSIGKDSSIGDEDGSIGDEDGSIGKDGFTEIEVDHLLVGLAKHVFTGVRKTLIWGAKLLLLELFAYNEAVLHSEKEKERMKDISRAYGLLMYHFKDEWYREKLRESINNSIERDYNFHKLYSRIKRSQKSKDPLMIFRIAMVEEMKHMLSTSPPLILHMPDNVVKDMINSITDTSMKSPLHWRRPVIMNSYHGTICVKGMAGNYEDMLKKMESDDNDNDSDDDST